MFPSLAWSLFGSIQAPAAEAVNLSLNFDHPYSLPLICSFRSHFQQESEVGQP